MDIKDRVIIVTGAASGMGRATVERLIKENVKVYACDVNQEALKEMNSMQDVVPYYLDVSSPQQCNQLIEKVINEDSRLDGVANFAGVIKRTGLLECSDEEFNYVTRVNVNGTFYMVREAARVMLKLGKGSIVNISSVWSDIGAKGVLAYCMSKGAVSQITRSAALDLAGSGVRVNEVRPGETNTPMLASERETNFTEKDIANKLKEIAVSIPEKRLADPSEIANAVVFLLSDESSYMQGASITVDGGYSIQ